MFFLGGMCLVTMAGFEVHQYETDRGAHGKAHGEYEHTTMQYDTRNGVVNTSYYRARYIILAVICTCSTVNINERLLIVSYIG